MEIKVEEYMKMDLYGLIGAESTATIKEIKAAYRKAALKCHPDKNPDNPKAAEEFRKLSKILEILLDEGTRNAYDQAIKARQEAKIRYEKLDAKRRKFTDDLEAREEAYRQSKLQAQKLKAELERIEKEGKRQLEEEIRLMQEQIKEQIRQQATAPAEPENVAYTVKLKWKADKDDPENGGYNYDLLHRMLAKYGDIDILLVSAKNGRGCVEYKTKDAAESAIKIEPGLASNPLKLSAMWKPKGKSPQRQTLHTSEPLGKPKIGLFPSTNIPTSSEKSSSLSFSSAPDIFAMNQPKMTDTEFESMVLNNLRRAEERKKLIEQMRKEEEEEK